MSVIQLNAHGFACNADGQIVFLDLRRDRYLSLDEAETDAFYAYISDPSSTRNERARRIAEQLSLEGLAWTPCSEDQVGASLRPCVDITGYPPNRRLKIRARDALQFLVAAVSASVQLKCLRLEQVINDARKRQHRLKARVQQFTPQEVHDLVEIHRSLQPLIFTAKNHCLFDSLALHMFLSAYGVSVRWIFGVKRHPFLAHCWIQFGDIVCNDSLEHTCLFHPIMEV